MTTPRVLLVGVIALGACRSTADVRPEVAREDFSPSPPGTPTAEGPAAPTKPSDPPDEYAAGLKRLLASRSLRCEFTTSATAFWESGSPRSEGGKDRMETHFDSIDVKNRTARLIGNQGATDVLVASGPAGLTFIERTDAGNFMMTSVIAWHGNEGDFAAVTSRHLVPVGFYKPPIASQLYGSCKVLQ